eukprot:3899327-Rhodomonas_salina.2
MQRKRREGGRGDSVPCFSEHALHVTPRSFSASFCEEQGTAEKKVEESQNICLRWLGGVLARESIHTSCLTDIESGSSWTDVRSEAKEKAATISIIVHRNGSRIIRDMPQIICNFLFSNRPETDASRVSHVIEAGPPQAAQAQDQPRMIQLPKFAARLDSAGLMTASTRIDSVPGDCRH